MDTLPYCMASESIGRAGKGRRKVSSATPNGIGKKSACRGVLHCESSRNGGRPCLVDRNRAWRMKSVAAPLDFDCAMSGMRALESHRIDDLWIVFPEGRLRVNTLPKECDQNSGIGKSDLKRAVGHGNKKRAAGRASRFSWRSELGSAVGEHRTVRELRADDRRATCCGSATPRQLQNVSPRASVSDRSSRHR